MRNLRVILIVTVAIVIGALNVPAANAQFIGSSGGGGNGGGSISFGGIGKSGGFHGRSFSLGKGRFVGRGGFLHHRHAHRFKYPRRYAYGWPVFGAAILPPIVRNGPEEEKVTMSGPPRVAEWKIYRVGTAGGCQSERVNVPQGAVTVFRC